MPQQRDPGGREGYVWPGFGLVAGAVAGAIVAILVSGVPFSLFIFAGAALGLVVGAVIQLLTER